MEHVGCVRGVDKEPESFLSQLQLVPTAQEIHGKSGHRVGAVERVQFHTALGKHPETISPSIPPSSSHFPETRILYQRELRQH